ncbi:MAG: hypothetical protein Q4G29_01640, partial [Pseudoscardovia radai]|nr:hypothetical protein [Pseudoscardovia radai]
ARERTMEIAQRTADGADGTNAAAGAGSDDAVADGAGSDGAGRASGADRANRGSSQTPGAADAATSSSSAAGQDADLPGGTPDEETSSSMHTEWAYGDDASRQPEKRAWWRNLGRNRNRKGDA